MTERGGEVTSDFFFLVCMGQEPGSWHGVNV